MKKLKLESLEVTSFATTPNATRGRGTVQGAANPTHNCPPQTYNPDICGDTMYFDCTLGCSQNTACPNGCIIVA
jgi:hypothetical protein